MKNVIFLEIMVQWTRYRSPLLDLGHATLEQIFSTTQRCFAWTFFKGKKYGTEILCWIL